MDHTLVFFGRAALGYNLWWLSCFAVCRNWASAPCFSSQDEGQAGESDGRPQGPFQRNWQDIHVGCCGRVHPKVLPLQAVPTDEHLVPRITSNWWVPVLWCLGPFLPTSKAWRWIGKGIYRSQENVGVPAQLKIIAMVMSIFSQLFPHHLNKFNCSPRAVESMNLEFRMRPGIYGNCLFVLNLTLGKRRP